VGRDLKTGQFIPVKEARRRKKTAVVETLHQAIALVLSNRGKRLSLEATGDIYPHSCHLSLAEYFLHVLRR
jgi:hypothetical protein